MTRRLAVPINPLRLTRAAAVLKAGGVIAYPTETVWGLGCDPRNKQAVSAVLALKKRSWRKGLILIGADFSQLAPYVDAIPAARLKAVRASWPGPHTWLMPASKHTPRWIRGRHHTVAVRVTSHPFVAALCRRFGGAMVSTSANRSGIPPTRSLMIARRRYARSVDLFIEGACGPHRQPSTIRDAVTGRVVRR